MSENKTDPRFYALRNAAFWDREAALKLIQDDPAVVEVKNSIGETALHFLAVENELEAVEFLAQHGSSVNTSNEFGDSAIIEAAMVGHPQMVDLLLRLGAEVDGPELLRVAEPAQREPMATILKAHDVAA